MPAPSAGASANCIDELGVRIPVYVLFTKADLIAGFVEFFDNLGREEREQVWGMTLPLDDGRDEGGSVAAFGARVRSAADAAERPHAGARAPGAGRAAPPADLRVSRSRSPRCATSPRSSSTEIFRPSRLEARPLLRGVYFTSGTQDGTPIDRLLGAMAGQFGLPRQAVTAFSGAGRSYFLTRLMREVVFGEAGLVSLDPKVERRQRLDPYRRLCRGGGRAAGADRDLDRELGRQSPT